MSLKKTQRRAAVCMVVFSYYPSDPRVRREAEALERSGILVDVVCLRGTGEPPYEVIGDIGVYRVMSAPVRKESIAKYLAYSLAFLMAATAKIMALSKKKGYGLIQAHNMPDFLVFAGLTHKLRKVPVVLDLHDLTVELYESKATGPVSRLLIPLSRLLERASCSFADALITTSNGFSERLVERGVRKEKITIVLNSADERIFKPMNRKKARSNGPVLLYHGTVAKRFGLHLAIRALGRLKKDEPSARLVIHGRYDPSYKIELEDEIGRLGLEGSVELGGYLRLEDVPEVISCSDIGVVPYLSDPFMDLALSTKIFEYAATGLPVAASRTKAIAGVFPDDCLKYFRPNDPDDMAQRIVELWRDKDGLTTYPVNAQKAYANIKWQVMSEKYVGAIRGLMEAA